MPYSHRLNRQLDRARENLVAWSARMGIIGQAPGLPRCAAWTEQDLRAFDYVLCSAGLVPDAPLAELDLASAWLCWASYGDDYYPSVFGRNLVAAKAQNRRLAAFMPAGDAAGAPASASPLEAGLADLWPRSTSSMSPANQQQLCGSVMEMLESWVSELADEALNRIPDPVDYLEMRRATFGCSLTISLARLAGRGQVPPEVYRSETIRDLEETASDYACLLNDVFSYQKEIEFEGQLHNGVLSVQRFLGCGIPAAVEVVNDLMTQRLRQFERIIATRPARAVRAAPARRPGPGGPGRVRPAVAGLARQHPALAPGLRPVHRAAVAAPLRRRAREGGGDPDRTRHQRSTDHPPAGRRRGPWHPRTRLLMCGLR